MPDCKRCSRHFSSRQAMGQHIENSPKHNICDECDKDFASWNGLKQHYANSRRHHYCESCNRLFGSKRGLNQHLDDVHYYCSDHCLFFDSQKALNNHYNRDDYHDYCNFCSILFDDIDDLNDHYDEYHYVCESCDLVFQSLKALKGHKASNHYYCKQCDRIFGSKSNLEHHLDSSLHKPRTIKCVGSGCTKKFISISAIILHAESGMCRAGITRQMVNEYAVQMDRKNIITNPSRLLTDGSGEYSPPAMDEYWATELSWSGSGFECFLCDKEFRTLQALNAHLQSPRHYAKIYHCPMKNCHGEFNTLSGLIQHVERGGCGVRQNRQVKKVMDKLTSGMRRMIL